MNDKSLLLLLILFCIISTLGNLNAIGGINEDLEYIRPKMRKVKISNVIIKFVPQWGTRAGLNPDDHLVRKSKVYILTVALSLIAYFNGLLWVTLEIFLCLLGTKTWILLYCFFGSCVYSIIIFVIDICYINPKVKKTEKERFMKLDPIFDMHYKEDEKIDNEK